MLIGTNLGCMGEGVNMNETLDPAIDTAWHGVMLAERLDCHLAIDPHAGCVECYNDCWECNLCGVIHWDYAMCWVTSHEALCWLCALNTGAEAVFHAG